jgi:hypothetical protein
MLARCAVGALTAFALFPAVAYAGATFDITHRTVGGTTNFTADYSYEDENGFEQTACPRLCVIAVTVRRGSKRVFYDFAPEDPDSYEDLVVTYRWSCRNSGLNRYRIELDQYATDEKVAPKVGTFRVPRCGRWRDRRVGRGYAARYQAEGYPNEYVSSVRCSPSSLLSGGRAAKWRCAVTHNNSYRECTETFLTHFRRRMEFKRWRTGARERRVTRSCRYF